MTKPSVNHPDLFSPTSGPRLLPTELDLRYQSLSLKSTYLLLLLCAIASCWELPNELQIAPRAPRLGDNIRPPHYLFTMPSEPTQATNSGIVTDGAGDRHIPESVRADGSTRKAIKIRPGYRPPEDVEVYKNRPAEAFRERGKRIGIPGASGLKTEQPTAQAASASGNKNAKRREARKKAKATDGTEEDGKDGDNPTEEQPKPEEVDPEAEKEKKARNLKKKLKQARDLQSKKDGGESLLPEQIAKVIKINELVRELEALGIDPEAETKTKPDEAS